MDHTINDVLTTDAGAGQILAMAGSNYRIILTGKETAGKMAIIEMLVPPNSGPIPHEHTSFQESFYVLDGEVEVKTKTRTYVAKTGAIVTIPMGGPVHAFKNKSAANTRLLCIVTPAGLEEFFLEAGKPTTPGTLPPPKELSAEEKKTLQALAEKYGQKLYPPDYLD
jgi:quercetin dioxygenase-like cupin family protein